MPIMRAEGRHAFTLDPGVEYQWTVEKAESGYAKKSGNEQIKIEVRVGDKNGTTRIFEYLTFSENAYFRVEAFLKSAGKYPGDGVDIYFDDYDLIGLSGWCTTKEEWNDQKQRNYSRIDEWIEADKQMPDRTWINRAKINMQKQEEVASEPVAQSAPSGDDVPF